jgi:hypothetical protein
MALALVGGCSCDSSTAALRVSGETPLCAAGPTRPENASRGLTIIRKRADNMDGAIRGRDRGVRGLEAPISAPLRAVRRARPHSRSSSTSIHGPAARRNRGARPPGIGAFVAGVVICTRDRRRARGRAPGDRRLAVPSDPNQAYQARPVASARGRTRATRALRISWRRRADRARRAMRRRVSRDTCSWAHFTGARPRRRGRGLAAVARIARSVGARGAIYAWPRERAGLSSTDPMHVALRPIAGPWAARGDGARVAPGPTLLRLGQDGLAVDDSP